MGSGLSLVRLRIWDSEVVAGPFEGHTFLSRPLGSHSMGNL
jgi:hypothetical protein